MYCSVSFNSLFYSICSQTFIRTFQLLLFDVKNILIKFHDFLDYQTAILNFKFPVSNFSIKSKNLLLT